MSEAKAVGQPESDRIGVRPDEVPDPQVAERATRRTFTAKYKLAVVEEYERADRGDRGAILRREGLYSSLMTEWRRQRDQGALAALKVARGPKPAAQPSEGALAAENARLSIELAQAREVIRIQGELSALLEKLSSSSVDRSESER